MGHNAAPAERAAVSRGDLLRYQGHPRSISRPLAGIGKRRRLGHYRRIVGRINVAFNGAPAWYAIFIVGDVELVGLGESSDLMRLPGLSDLQLSGRSAESFS